MEVSAIKRNFNQTFMASFSYLDFCFLITLGDGVQSPLMSNKIKQIILLNQIKEGGIAFFLIMNTAFILISCGF